MGLTTDRKVWEYLLLVFMLLTVTFSVLFYLTNIFLSLVFGFVLIAMINQAVFIFRRLTEDFTPLQKKVIAGCVIVLAVVVIAAALLIQAGYVAGIVMDMMNPGADYEAIADDSTIAADSLLADPVEKQTNVLYDIARQLIRSSSGIVSTFSSALSELSSLLVSMVLTIPLLIGLYYSKKDDGIRALDRAVPQKYRRPFWETVASIIANMERYLFLKVFEAVFLSIVYSIGFFIAGVPYAVPLGLLAGLFSLIPYIGFLFAAVPVVLLAYSEGTPVVAGAVLTIIVAQIIDLFILLPRMMSEEVRIYPLTAIVLTLVSWQLFGIAGLVLGIPVYLVYKIVLISCYNLFMTVFAEDGRKNDRRDITAAETIPEKTQAAD